MTEKNTPNIDWEVSEEYYHTDENQREFKLEDFMETGEESVDDSFASALHDASGDALQRTIADVRQVMSLAVQGRTIDQIAEELQLDSQYVYDIQVTAQGFHEDDEIAVAHLLMMK